jgi:uncharacterized protein, PH0010 family
MLSEMDPADGEAAVRTARAVARSEVTGRPAEAEMPDRFSEKKGVFVTISRYPSGDLRGCIGYPEPIFPLREALRMSAAAACHDPRFNDLTKDELDNCTLEVTILTVPERIENNGHQDLLSKIVIGRDGLILELNGRRGLLLPQVASEWGWDTEEFLQHLSNKAGLPINAWKHPDAVIERFQGDIFTEVSPGGDIVRK